MEVFQLTTSRRGRRTDLGYDNGRITFQLTTSRRGRQFHNLLHTYPVHFNSRPHEEVDNVLRNGGVKNEHFNSRPHEEVDRNIIAMGRP